MTTPWRWVWRSVSRAMVGNIASMVVDNFCSEVAKLVVCRKCFDNSWGVCDINVSQDEDSLDRIIIEKKKNGQMTVETDIIVHYTEPTPSPELRGRKMKQLEYLVRTDLPEDANLLRTHEHGSWDSDVWGLHIHAFYRAKDIPDAARMANELARIIEPEVIEKKLDWGIKEVSNE